MKSPHEREASFLVDPIADPIALEVLWQRLLSILEEASWTIVQTSFSSVVREGWDFSCLLYDGTGRLLAQNGSVSSKIGVWHTSIPVVLKKFPMTTLVPGDIIITNDPWLTEGHLYDTTIVMPLFRNGALIGFGECIVHLSDIGGAITNAARDVYEEGLQIPISKLYEAGRENEVVRAFIEANVRTPRYDIGDLRALVSALRVVEQKVEGLLDSYQIGNLSGIADAIIKRTEIATRDGIRATLPPGLYEYEIIGDGFDEPTVVHVAVTVGDGEVRVDFTGSSAQRRVGINCPLNYARAWAVFAIKAIVSPDIPNNLGSFLPIQVVAPAGSILNPLHPAPVRMRASTAHYITPAVQGALSRAVPNRSIAESGSPTWVNRFFGQGRDGQPFAVLVSLAGGLGARSSLDGIHCLNYPTNLAATSIEGLEEVMPIMVIEKALIPDSGGPGKYRGGSGQRFCIRAVGDEPIRVLLQHERTKRPAAGAAGGLPGRVGETRLNGKVLPSKTQIELTAGDVLEMQTPGGGGYYPPEQRDPLDTVADLREGIISAESAARDFGFRPSTASARAINKNVVAVASKAT